MRKIDIIGTLALALLLSFNQASAGTTDIQEKTRTFLDAYAGGDREKVLAAIDPAITFYGSDAAEIFHGKAAVETMLANDQKLWGGSAHIGAMEHVSVVATKEEASIFFDATFSVGARPALPVRFAMFWRRSGKQWLLVQSLNVVPTVGQSAEQLLGLSHDGPKQAGPTQTPPKQTGPNQN